MSCYAHSWKTYTGLTDVFEYCSICDIRKGSKDRDIYKIILDQAYERALSGLPAKEVMLSVTDYALLENIVFKDNPPVKGTSSIILVGPHGYLNVSKYKLDLDIHPFWKNNE